MDYLNSTYILNLLDPTTVMNIVAGVSITIITSVVIGIIVVNYKSKIKNREEKKKKKINHSKNLIDKEFKLKTGTLIGFSDKHNLELCIKGTTINAQTYENYSNEANVHLEKGYPKVWKHKIERDSIINNHNLTFRRSPFIFHNFY